MRFERERHECMRAEGCRWTICHSNRLFRLVGCDAKHQKSSQRRKVWQTSPNVGKSHFDLLPSNVRVKLGLEKTENNPDKLGCWKVHLDLHIDPFGWLGSHRNWHDGRMPERNFCHERITSAKHFRRVRFIFLRIRRLPCCQRVLLRGRRLLCCFLRHRYRDPNTKLPFGTYIHVSHVSISIQWTVYVSQSHQQDTKKHSRADDACSATLRHSRIYNGLSVRFTCLIRISFSFLLAALPLILLHAMWE